MTDTDAPISYRSVTRHPVGSQTWAHCRGINHSDAGEIVQHDRCGADVVKREDGRLFNIELSGTYAARKFSCYHGDHECAPPQVEARAAERAQAIAEGVITKGVTVEVFKGRKVPKGTVGRVFWEGEDTFSGKPKIGIRTGDGVNHFLLAEHCKPV